MNLTPQVTYKYFYEAGKQGNDVKIERTCMGNAYATSDSVGDLGPFTMCFDVETGKGKGRYSGAYLEEYAEGEIKYSTYEVTFEHTGPYIDHTVIIRVSEGEEILEEAHKAMTAQNMGLSNYNGYKPKPTEIIES